LTIRPDFGFYVLFALPIEESALFPMGEILLGDGAALKLRGEDGTDFGQRIEP